MLRRERHALDLVSLTYTRNREQIQVKVNSFDLQRTKYALHYRLAMARFLFIPKHIYTCVFLLYISFLLVSCGDSHQDRHSSETDEKSISQKKLSNLQDVYDFFSELEEKSPKEGVAALAIRFHRARVLGELKKILNGERPHFMLEDDRGEYDLIVNVYGGIGEYREQLLDCTRILIDEGLYYPHDVTQNFAKTPLASAAAKGYLPVVEYLVNMGVNITKGGTIKTFEEDKTKLKPAPSPLAEACAGGHYDVAVYLFEKGAARGGINKNPTLLHDACKGKSKELVELLIQKGYDVNRISSERETPLGIACANGDLTVAQLLLDNGASVNCESKKQSLVALACKSGNAELVKLLLSRGAKVSSLDNSCPPLIDAVALGNKELVDILIQAGCNVNERDKNEMTALIIAITRGKHDIVQLLEQNGAKAPPLYLLKSHLPAYVRSYLRECCRDDHQTGTSASYESITQLIQRGWLKLDGKIATELLPWAIASGSSELVKLMIENGADVNADVDMNRFNYEDYEADCLHVAALESSQNKEGLEILKILLKNGAKIKNESKEQTLVWAVVNGCSLEPEFDNQKLDVIKFLKEQGCDLLATREDGASAVTEAISQGSVKLVKYFIENGAVVSSIPNKKSAIHYCTNFHMGMDEQGCVEILNLLIQNGAGVNDADEQGLTPLLYACQTSYLTDIIKLLIEKGANVNAKSDLIQTPLILATQRNTFEQVEMLVNAGCDLDVTDYEGCSALMYACKNRNFRIAKFLIEKGADVKQICTVPDHLSRTEAHLPRPDQSALMSAVVADDYEITDLIASSLKQGETPEIDSLINQAIIYAQAQKTYRAYVALGNHYKLPVDSMGHALVKEFLLWSICREYDYNVVRAAIEQGYPVTTDADMAFPLEAAISVGNYEIINLLLKHGADVNQRNTVLGSTPLSVAIVTGNYDVFQLLIKLGAKVTTRDAAVAVSEAPDNKKWLELLDSAGCDFTGRIDALPGVLDAYLGDTLLGLASRAGAVEAAQFILSKGVDIDERQKDGKTALMIAVENGHMHFVKFLMANGANPRIMHDGFTALDIARVNGNKDIVKYLESES